MNNREKLNAMTNEEIAAQLCNLVEFVASALDHDCACAYCPANKLCSRGNNGFLALLNQEAEVN